MEWLLPFKFKKNLTEDSLLDILTEINLQERRYHLVISVLTKAALVVGLALVTPAVTANNDTSPFKEPHKHHQRVVEPKKRHLFKRLLNTTFFSHLHQRIGWASWYGPGFEGKGTAYGRTFHTNLPMCAMLHIPAHTLVTVRNLANGKEAQCTIEDTGDFEKYGRIIDLSHAIKEAIGMRDTGRVMVYY